MKNIRQFGINKNIKMLQKIILVIVVGALLAGLFNQTAKALDVPKIVLEGAAADFRRIDLYWNALPISENSEAVEGKFEIFKDGQLFKKIDQVFIHNKYRISHSSCDYPVEESTTYRYYVRAYDIHGNFTGQSNEITVTTPPRYSFDHLPAFPGAEGFGAKATGGRGGRVVYVTNLNSSGPGSLRDALTQSGPRYILFKVSGLISLDGWWNMTGNYTFAGHTSKGGVMTRGYITSSAEDKNYQGMNNVIIRHLRSRPDHRFTDRASWPSEYNPTSEELTWGSPGGWDDAFRLINTRDVIIDHCSFGRAGDETIQVANSNFVSIQNTIFAEAIGNHYGLGGMLINYTSPKFPLNNLSIHHNMWNRVGGRLPEISNNSGYANDHVFNYEISNNLLWDPGSVIWVNSTGYPYNPQDQLYLHLNMVGNVMRTRNEYRQGFIVRDILKEGYSLFLKDNKMSLYPQYTDYQIVYGNTDFYRNHPNTFVGKEVRKTERHSYAPITYTQSVQLTDYMIRNVGAFPRDPMDKRLINYLEKDKIDPTHLCARPANDGHEFNWLTPPPPSMDSDDDGMPDWWELHNGLDPLVQDHNGRNLSTIYTGESGYDNIEIYLNRLSDHLVNGSSLTEMTPHVYPVSIQSAVASNGAIKTGQESTVTFTITPASPDSIDHVELSLDMLSAPYASPSPEVIATTRSGSTWTYTYTVPADRDPGDYQVLAHAVNNNGQHGYSIIPIDITASENSRIETPDNGNGNVSTGETNSSDSGTTIPSTTIPPATTPATIPPVSAVISLPAAGTTTQNGLTLQLTPVISKDVAGLGKNLLDQIGNRPIVELKVYADGKQINWENKNEPLVITLDYTPTTEELMEPDHIVVWFFDGKGKKAEVPSGRYDTLTKKVSFTTTHLGLFAVVNVKKTYNDISKSYVKINIEALASKGFYNWLEGDQFNPSRNITRGEFIYLLVTALDLHAPEGSSFSDVKSTDFYYRATGIAKRLGISNGMGNNRLGAARSITRQDMSTLISRALKVAKKSYPDGSISELKQFNDADKVSNYAKDSMSELVKAGVLKGYNKNLEPRKTFTMQEAAAVIYRIYNK